MIPQKKRSLNTLERLLVGVASGRVHIPHKAPGPQKKKRSGSSGRDCGRPGFAEREHLVQITGKVADRVIAALDQRSPHVRVMREHGAIVEHFVACGRDQIVALRPGDGWNGKRTQFVDMTRLNHNTSTAMPQRLLAEITAQILLD